jgi:glycosyltransferase involved in cell wall biosynthesis
MIRLLVGQKIERIMRSASLVIVGNEYLLNKAKRAGGKNVAHIPTVVDLDKYHIKCPKASSDFTIGWIGTPITSEYLRIIEPALDKLYREGGIRIVLVGSGPKELRRVNADVRDWNESTEVQEIHTFDVGVMPLTNSPWAQGKSGFKIIQYMACGLPVVASPVGYNSLLVKDGVNGYLAGSTDEWVDRLRRLKDSPAIREEMGRRGRKIVEEKFCIQVTAPLVKKLLEKTI